MNVVLRAPMRSRLDDVDAAAAVERALRLGLCGVGGRLATAPASFDDAVLAVTRAHGERTARRLVRFAAEEVGTFVWTRTGGGELALGRLTGAWFHDPDPEAFGLDLTHVRATAWAGLRLGAADVPAIVTAAFARGGRNLQRIGHPEVFAATEEVWRRIATGASR